MFERQTLLEFPFLPLFLFASVYGHIVRTGRDTISQLNKKDPQAATNSLGVMKGNTLKENQSNLSLKGFTPYAQVPVWVLRSGKNLSHGARALYAVIMSYADNKSKTAFPARSTLAEDLGVTEWSISKYIKELESFGALIVERRRNKNTGNFYSNNYFLVFNQPRQQESLQTSPIEPCVKKPTPRSVQKPTVSKPTMLTRSTEGFTFDSGESKHHVSPLPPKVSEPNRTHDPVSPKFATSGDRRSLITLITHIAAGEASVDDLEAWLTEVFGTDYLLGHLFYDQGWQPPTKCVDRWEAGKWLNTFLNEWKKEEQLVWRGE